MYEKSFYHGWLSVFSVPTLEGGEDGKEKGVRRISRRSSEVQLDPSLTEEDMCLPPAMKAKERTASGDRRSLHGETYFQFY